MILSSILSLVSAAFSATLAVAVAIRAGRSITRWAFVAGMLLLALEGLLAGFGFRQATLDHAITWQIYRVIAASFVPGMWLVFSLGYSRGNATEFRFSWRYVAAAMLLLPPALAIGFRAHLFESAATEFPLDSSPYQFGHPGLALYVLLLVGAILVLVQLERTYRASVGTMRWRIKFTLMGLGLLFVVRLYTSSQAIVQTALDPKLQTVNAVAAILACAMITRSLLRSRHFETNLYPSRAVLFNSITLLFVGIYLFVIGAAAKVLSLLGGDTSFPVNAFLILVALVGLALLLQSDHFRQEIRHFVTRNFQRPTHDYRAAWHRFTSEMSADGDAAGRYAQFARLIADVFAALSVTIWRIEDSSDRLVLAASTSVAAPPGDLAAPTVEETRDISDRFRSETRPMIIESPQESWAATLRRCHPAEFPNGGVRICIPLIARGEPLGCVVVGDRINGTPFSGQDLDMLRCVGDHVAASLLTDRLSSKLLQAREFEAFQAMAAFFIHDLKNTTTTLNLIVKNLPVHFENPDFRQDALHGIAETENQMNKLIDRLENLRSGFQIHPIQSDLNAIIIQSVEGWMNKPGISVTTDLHPLPPLMVDPDQISKVVLNLIINAVDACIGGGSVHIATECDDRWAVLVVKDDGCGMTEDFMKHSLFRAFQSSKKRGFGIGMYQSKMIVEAHNGRISVKSTPGAGTTFQVFLPLAQHPPSLPADPAVGAKLATSAGK